MKFDWLFCLFLIFLKLGKIQGDLEGESMKMSELNGAMDVNRLKVFECMDRKNCQVGVPTSTPSCAERRRMIGLSENATDKYVIVTAELGGTVQLECHYCHEQDDETVQKVWYYYEKFLASKRFKLVPLHLEYPEHARKFVITEDHRLLIRNFTEADGALYFCQGYDDNAPKFNFLVDAVDQSSDLEPKRGSIEDYADYYNTNIVPLNKKLKDEYKNDIKNWFVNSSVGQHNYNVSHKWTSWGSCRSCGRAHGLRMRTGTCQLSIPTLSSADSAVKQRGAMEFGYKFSCHSAMLKRFLTSKLRKGVNAIVDFIEASPCEAECTHPGIGSMDSSRNDDGNSAIAQNHVLSAPTLTVLGTVGEELTLRCTDNPTADIVWLRNNSLLTLPEVTSKRSKVMTYTRGRGGLHFPVLTHSDTGDYSCIVDDLVKMIFKLETQEPVEDPPIPETWIWIHLASFSLACILIWLIIVIFIARVNWRTQAGYQPLSTAEEVFLKRKDALLEGRDDHYERQEV